MWFVHQEGSGFEDFDSDAEILRVGDVFWGYLHNAIMCFFYILMFVLLGLQYPAFWPLYPTT